MIRTSSIRHMPYARMLHTWVMSHTRVRHEACVRFICMWLHMCVRDMPHSYVTSYHTRVSCLTERHEACLSHAWDMRHVWDWYVCDFICVTCRIHSWRAFHTRVSCLTYESCLSHAWDMRHVWDWSDDTHVTYVWVVSHMNATHCSLQTIKPKPIWETLSISETISMSRMYESCHIWMPHTIPSKPSSLNPYERLHLYERLLLCHVCMSHVTYEGPRPRPFLLNLGWMVYLYVYARLFLYHVCMSHVTYECQRLFPLNHQA